MLRNHCLTLGDTIDITDRCPEDDSIVDYIKYAHCSGNTEVWYYKYTKAIIHGLAVGNSIKMIGRKNRDVNASETVREFFKNLRYSQELLKVGPHRAHIIK